MQTSVLWQLESPQIRNQENVKALIWNVGQMAYPDTNYIQNVGDLVALGGDREHSWGHGIFEELFTKASGRLSKVCSPANIPCDD